MNNLCADIGWKSINHEGEQLCGDHVDIVEQNERSTVIVLADGLGSGVKASILSTLTSKIISTMMAEGLSLEECVSTIAATLPICSVRGVAYSTFTIIHLIDNSTVELMQYDNPQIIMIRNCENYEYPRNELHIDGKSIYHSTIKLQENDILIAMSDGCSHAGMGLSYNFGWKREDIADYMTTFASKEGKHIICGGTTSSIAAKYLRKPLNVSLNFEESDIPPTAELEGVDLVTEGVITVNRVIEYAKDALDKNEKYEYWSTHRDGASLICRILFEEATDINFFVGRAVNPAHQNPDLPINFNIKMNLVEELSECLRKMGKRIKVSYF